jgi:hypothetical protein
MKYSDIVSSVALQYSRTNKVVPILMGPPGGGKSACARDVGLAMGVHPDNIFQFFASLRDPVDLLGTPKPNDEYTSWKPPQDWWRMRTGKWLVVLEELPDADKQMQNPLCGVIHDRRSGDLTFSPEVFFIATGNRTEDKSGANRIQSKLAGRVRFIDFATDLDDWCAYALDAGIDPVIIQFLRFKPDMLHDFDPSRRSNPTPRTWEKVSYIPTELPTGVYFEHVAGDVGEGAAAVYTGFRRIYESLPDMDKLLASPATYEVPTAPDVRYALAGALAHASTKDNFDRVVTYVNRMPKEFSVMCVNDAIKLRPEVKSTKAFAEWVQSNAEVLFA